MKNAKRHAARRARIVDAARKTPRMPGNDTTPRKAGRPAAAAAPGSYTLTGTPFDSNNAAAVYAVSVRAAVGKNKWLYQRYARPENLFNWYDAAAIRRELDGYAGDAAADYNAARMELLTAGDTDAARVAGEKVIAAATWDAAALDARAARLIKIVHVVQQREKAAPVYVHGVRVNVKTGEFKTVEFDMETVSGDTLPPVWEHIQAAALAIAARRPRIVAGAYIAANKGITAYCNQYDTRKNHRNDTKEHAREKAARAARAARAVALWGLSPVDADEYAARPGFIGGRDAKGGTPRRPSEMVSLDAAWTPAAAVADGNTDAARADYARPATDYDNAAADMPAPAAPDAAAPAAVDAGDAAAVLNWLTAAADARRITAGQLAAARAVVMLSGAIPGGRGYAIRPVDVAQHWIDNPAAAPDYAADAAARKNPDAARRDIARRVSDDLRKLSRVDGLRDILTGDADARPAARRAGFIVPAPLTPAAVAAAIARIDAGEKSDARPVKLRTPARPVALPAPAAAAPRTVKWTPPRPAWAYVHDTAPAAVDGIVQIADARRRWDAARRRWDAARAAVADADARAARVANVSAAARAVAAAAVARAVADADAARRDADAARVALDKLTELHAAAAAVARAVADADAARRAGENADAARRAAAVELDAAASELLTARRDADAARIDAARRRWDAARRRCQMMEN